MPVQGTVVLHLEGQREVLCGSVQSAGLTFPLGTLYSLMTRNIGVPKSLLRCPTESQVVYTLEQSVHAD